MFTYTEIKTKARAIIAAKPMPVRYALDEAYAELFAAHEEAEREAEAEADARVEARHARAVNRWYA